MAQRGMLFGAVVIFILNVVGISANDCTFDPAGGTVSDVSSNDKFIKNPKVNVSTGVMWGTTKLQLFNVREFYCYKM